MARQRIRFRPEFFVRVFLEDEEWSGALAASLDVQLSEVLIPRVGYGSGVPT